MIPKKTTSFFSGTRALLTGVKNRISCARKHWGAKTAPLRTTGKQSKDDSKLAARKLFARSSVRGFCALVLLPFLIVALYYLFVASDRYVSSAAFMIEHNDSSSYMTEGFHLFGIASQNTNDLRILESFVKTPDMLDKLQQDLDLRQHYTTGGDWLSRLAADASYDDFLSYYRDHISIRHNEVHGLLELGVQAFTPTMAEQIAIRILRQSEAFVNRINQNLAREQQALVKKELAVYEAKLRAAKKEMIDFQNQHGLLSAAHQSTALNSVLNELQAELIRKRTQLQTLSSYMNARAPEIVALQQRIKAIEKQLGKEQQQLTGADQTSMNSLSAHQQELELNVELATQAYSSALVALEATRTEASRKLKQLVVVSSPYRAEEPAYPRVAYNLTNVFIVLFMLFWVARMLYASVLEHRD